MRLAVPALGWHGAARPDADQLRHDRRLERRRLVPRSNADSVGDAGEPLVSVNSYGYGFEKATMYGPFMGSASQAKTLYDALD